MTERPFTSDMREQLVIAACSHHIPFRGMRLPPSSCDWAWRVHFSHAASHDSAQRRNKTAFSRGLPTSITGRGENQGDPITPESALQCMRTFGRNRRRSFDLGRIWLSPKVKTLAPPSREVNKGDAAETRGSCAGEGFPLKNRSAGTSLTGGRAIKQECTPTSSRPRPLARWL